MYFAHTMHQVERTRTRAEQREENRVRGELAAALSRPWRRARQRRRARQALLIEAIPQPRRELQRLEEATGRHGG